MGLVQKSFSDIITFSRSSNATRVGPNGLVQYAPHNLQVRSQEFENAIWTKSGASITANATAAPDGTVTSDKLVEDSSSGNHQTYQLGLTVVAQSYTASVYAKAAERTYIWLALFNGTTNGGVYFNLANGTAGSLGTDVTAASITPAGNGWYRCSITRTMVASANAGINIQLADSTPSINYVGNGSSGVFIWGAQLAVGPLPLDYTPTTTAAVYGPRFDYDPVTLAARGLLVEEQRTNIVTYSEQFDNAAWTKNLSSVTANSVSAPDGTVTGDKLVEDNSTGVHYLNVVGTLTGSTVYSISVYAKAGERSRIQIAGAGGAWGSSATATFDLSAGTVVSTSVWSSSSISAVGNGWYRCSVTGTTVAVPSSAQYLQLVLIASGTTQSYAGDGTSGIYIWGAQMEAGAFATSYIPTLASTVTRSADVASVNTLSPWFNATEGTLFAEGNFTSSTFSTAKGLTSLVDNASNNTSIYAVSSSTVRQEILVGGAAQATFNLSYSSSIKAATAYKANDTNAAVNGTTGTTDTSCSIPTITSLQLGGVYGGTSFQMNGWLRRVAFYPRRLLDAEIQALTS